MHFGIIAGEVTAFFLAENVIGFAAIAVCALVVSAGFMFKDHDTTFTFEGSATNGPCEEEAHRRASNWFRMP